MTRQRQAGFTLVELMVSLTIFSFAIAGVLSVAVGMTQGHRDQRAAVDAESAARVPLDFMVDAVRQASPGAPTGNIFDLTTCSTSALVVNNNFGGNGWDQLDVIFASGAVVTSTRSIWADQPADLTSVVVNDASQLSVGDTIVISNLSQGHLAQITAIGAAAAAGTTLTLAVTGCGTPAYPSGGYASGSLVIRALHAQFGIGTINNVPTLMMTSVDSAVTEPLAQGIEDLQIALGVDPGNNAADPLTEIGAAANDDDWVGNVSGDSPIAGTLRAVRITLIARTATGYQGFATPFNRPAAEDHAASATFDTYRRRVLRAMIDVRNFGESP